jgi:hypothetical protein
MGDVPLAFVETVGGVRVSEDDHVAVGKNDVRDNCVPSVSTMLKVEQILSFKVGRA